MPSTQTINSLYESFVQAGQQMFSRNGRKISQSFVAALGALFTVSVFALAVPDAADLGYAIYDTVVNDILSGPIGFVGGVLLVVLGAVNITESWLLAVGCIISGSAVIQADAIVASLGMPIGLI